jgi:hypothetical protein
LLQAVLYNDCNIRSIILACANIFVSKKRKQEIRLLVVVYL